MSALARARAKYAILLQCPGASVEHIVYIFHECDRMHGASGCAMLCCACMHACRFGSIRRRTTRALPAKQVNINVTRRTHTHTRASTGEPIRHVSRALDSVQARTKCCARRIYRIIIIYSWRWWRRRWWCVLVGARPRRRVLAGTGTRLCWCCGSNKNGYQNNNSIQQ